MATANRKPWHAIFGLLERDERVFAVLLAVAMVGGLASLGLEQIRARASADPDLATEVQALAEQEMESYRQRIVSLSVLDRRGRVAEFLLDMEDATSGANGWAELLLAQQEAAELLGSTQETVSRVLGEMVRNRWIERRGRRFRILHREAVRASASGDLPKPAPGRHLLLPAG